MNASDDDMIRRGDAIAVIVKAQTASCTCETKTNDPYWHRDGCRYRILRDVEAMIDHVRPATIPAVQVVVKPDRETFDALCAMRDSINEYVPMPSLESDLLQGPENSVFCATVAEAVIQEIKRLRAMTAKPSPDEHYDDYCIRQFAKMMSEKMAASRAKGRSGWNDPEKCSVEYLRSLLYEHLDKGDPVDVANFCMMLRHYEASTYREACNCQPQPSPEWLTNCAVCGRVVDTREVSEGGDPHGCKYDAGWACSSECAEKLSPDPEWLTAQPGKEVMPDAERSDRHTTPLDTSPGVAAGAVPSPDVAALVEALEKIAQWPDYRLPSAASIARAALARLKGGAA